MKVNVPPSLVLAALVGVSLVGCAGMDEHICGKGYIYRDGMCAGFGQGFNYHWKAPRSVWGGGPQDPAPPLSARLD